MPAPTPPPAQSPAICETCADCIEGRVAAHPCGDLLGDTYESRRARVPLFSRVSLLSMKAARFHQHGGPEVLVYEDVPEPKLHADQVMVRVHACALNHL